MAVNAGKVMHFADLCACRGVRVKRWDEPSYEEIRPEACYISFSSFTLEHDRSLGYQVGDHVMLQLELETQCHILHGRVTWVVKQELLNVKSPYHTWFQYGFELESDLHPDLFQELCVGAKRTWWSFKPMTFA